jgi:hypothetical protein
VSRSYFLPKKTVSLGRSPGYPRRVSQIAADPKTTNLANDELLKRTAATARTMFLGFDELDAKWDEISGI